MTTTLNADVRRESGGTVPRQQKPRALSPGSIAESGMGNEKILDRRRLRGACACAAGRKGAPLALSLSRAIYQRGKTSPKHSNEPTNMLSLRSHSLRYPRMEKGAYSLEDLSRMTDDGKLPASLKRKKPLQDYGIYVWSFQASHPTRHTSHSTWMQYKLCPL